MNPADLAIFAAVGILAVMLAVPLVMYEQRAVESHRKENQ